ncbi:MAG: PAS domain S-box protein [Syntrophobacterales bacterium]|nr:PAS domain S-box protein [Syntrophobacterales bacterium]
MGLNPLIKLFFTCWKWCRLERLSLVWQFSIPFVVLATLGTCFLLFIAIRAQDVLMSRYEERLLTDAYEIFTNHVKQKGSWALSLAGTFAANNEAKKYLKENNREKLKELFLPTYKEIADKFSIAQFHFHTKDGKSFLRLQTPHIYGDDVISYRKTIQDVHRTKTDIAGVERGVTGLSIRGVAPIMEGEELIGTVEIGFRLDNSFLEALKKNIFMEVSILVLAEEVKEPGRLGTLFFKLLASTYHPFFESNSIEYEKVYREGRQIQRFVEDEDRYFRVLIAPFRDYKGDTIGVVEIGFDRSSQLARARSYLVWMFVLGIVGVILSVFSIYIVSFSFTRPIVEMIEFSIKISSGYYSERLDIRPGGELGILADALNDMIASLSESRRKLEEYSQKLEEMVQIRTRALQESEEKYRTLVENIPLVVYRALNDGRIVFINRYIETLSGFQVNDVLSNRNFWKEKVAPEDRARVWPLMDRCTREGVAFSVEYRMNSAFGRTIYVRERALPHFDENGEVEVIDGFIADVSDRYQLQQQIIRAEELKTLSEISARLAHEIRNPLVVAGGFTRRLLKEFDTGTEQAKKLEIILSEIRRLEEILLKTMDYLKPFEISPKPIHLKEYLEQFFEKYKSIFNTKGIVWSLSVPADIPPVMLDEELMEQGLRCIVGTLVFYAAYRSTFLCSVKKEDQFVYIELSTEPTLLSDDDIEHFFYPFTRHQDTPEMIDLPVAKIIIHKHGGWVEISKSGGQAVTLTIIIPV